MMFAMDTDTLTLLLLGDQRVIQRRSQVTDEVGITAITRIEILQGRFASVMKAENGERLLLAQQRLAETERDLRHFLVLDVSSVAALEFDRLRQIKGVKRIGRGDLLTASIALASDSTLVSRNLKDFRKIPGLRVENWVD